MLAGKATKAMQRCIEGRCAASWPVKYFLACLLVGGQLFSKFTRNARQVKRGWINILKFYQIVMTNIHDSVLYSRIKIQNKTR